MTRRGRTRCVHNLNRVLIAGLSIAAMLADGGQFGDLMLTAALVLWLWLPECDALELVLIKRLQGKTSAPRRAAGRAPKIGAVQAG